MVKLNFANKPVLEWKGENSIARGRIISFLNACKMISKWCLYHIVRVKELDSKTPLIELVPVPREFPDVFPNDLLGILLNGIFFGIDYYLIQIPFRFLIFGCLRSN